MKCNDIVLIFNIRSRKTNFLLTKFRKHSTDLIAKGEITFPANKQYTESTLIAIYSLR